MAEVAFSEVSPTTTKSVGAHNAFPAVSKQQDGASQTLPNPLLHHSSSQSLAFHHTTGGLHAPHRLLGPHLHNFYNSHDPAVWGETGDMRSLPQSSSGGAVVVMETAERKEKVNPNSGGKDQCVVFFFVHSPASACFVRLFLFFPSLFARFFFALRSFRFSVGALLSLLQNHSTCLREFVFLCFDHLLTQNTMLDVLCVVFFPPLQFLHVRPQQK